MPVCVCRMLQGGVTIAYLTGRALQDTRTPHRRYLIHSSVIASGISQRGCEYRAFPPLPVRTDAGGRGAHMPLPVRYPHWVSAVQWLSYLYDLPTAQPREGGGWVHAVCVYGHPSLYDITLAHLRRSSQGGPRVHTYLPGNAPPGPHHQHQLSAPLCRPGYREAYRPSVVGGCGRGGRRHGTIHPTTNTSPNTKHVGVVVGYQMG